MKQRIFTIYDSKAEAYLPPFFLPETGQALRAFGDAVNDKETEFYKHPEDYTLFEVGTFENRNGRLVSALTPKSIAAGIELVRNPENTQKDELTPTIEKVEKL